MTAPLNMEQALERAARNSHKTAVQRHSDGNLSTYAGDSSGLDEMNSRKLANRKGCEALCDAIEDLVVRTSRRIAIPKEWKHKPLSFARAYLGIEVRA